MVKLTFIFIGLFIIIHFTLYYWNIDPLNVYNNKKTLKEEMNKVNNEELPTYDFKDIRNNLEECLNELKQYNTINVNNEPTESFD